VLQHLEDVKAGRVSPVPQQKPPPPPPPHRKPVEQEKPVQSPSPEVSGASSVAM